MCCQIVMVMTLQLRTLTSTSPEQSRSRALTIFPGCICLGSTIFPGCICSGFNRPNLNLADFHLVFCQSYLSLALPQLSGPSQQPGSAAASRRVLEPDILEVSHLCGCMYWERLDAYLCLTFEHMIFSLKHNYILEEAYTVMHVNSHALPSVNSILLQPPVPWW